MATFLKNVFSSCLGTLLALTLGVLLLIGIGSAVGSLQSKEEISDQSILSITLPEVIPERTNNTEMGWEKAFSEEKVWGIHELTYALEEAATDDKIKAVLIETGGGASPVHMDLIRKGIQKIKAEGKKVYTYSDYYGQMNYYMASTASKVFLHPMGQVELKGFAISQPFMKSALENLGIEAEVYYAGDFKSATEPVRSDKMSEENRMQLRELLTEIHNSFVDTIATSRGLSSADVSSIINEYKSRTATSALNLGLVDALGYQSEMIQQIRDDLEVEEDDQLSVVTLNDYRSKLDRKKDYKVKDRIAVVYAEGELRATGSEEGMITAKKYLPMLRSIRKDDKVKAVVLRVNSPGGDVFTSDNILRELEMIQANGVPVIASMGDVAASGGYYISMGADSIFVNPKTITGSIGVFTVFPNFNKLLKDKLEINVDTVLSAPYANLGNLAFERSERDAAIFQAMIDSFYLDFLDRVAGSRDMTREEVHEVAQGRIWMGEKAVELGLVDKIADLDDAIASAAKMAGLEEYRLDEYPKIKTPLAKLTEELEGTADDGRNILEGQVSQWIPQYDRIKRLLTEESARGKIEYYLPYQVDWE